MNRYECLGDAQFLRRSSGLRTVSSVFFPFSFSFFFLLSSFFRAGVGWEAGVTAVGAATPALVADHLYVVSR